MAYAHACAEWPAESTRQVVAYPSSRLVQESATLETTGSIYLSLSLLLAQVLLGNPIAPHSSASAQYALCLAFGEEDATVLAVEPP